MQGKNVEKMMKFVSGIILCFVAVLLSAKEQDTCFSIAQKYQAELDLIRLAVAGEIDSFEISKNEIDKNIAIVQREIDKLKKMASEKLDKESGKIVSAIKEAMKKLPARVLWEMMDPEGWKATKAGTFRMEPQNERTLVPGISSGLMKVEKDWKTGQYSFNDGLPSIHKKVKPGTFSGYNRMVIWLYPEGSTDRHLDINASAPGYPVLADTDRNHWMLNHDWNRVEWDYNYHDKKYIDRMDRITLRALNRGYIPGEDNFQKYYIGGAVLLKVRPRKSIGWEPDPSVVITSQEGYKPIGKKTALVSADNKSDEFVVRDIKDKKEVFKGRLKKIENKLGAFKIADFSGLEKPGLYRVEAGKVKSHPFRIDEKATYPALNAAMYFLRCDRSACDTPYHKATSLDDAVRLDNGKHQDFTGGWYDAGDVFQMTPNTMKVCMNLSLLSETVGLMKFSPFAPVQNLSNVLLSQKRITKPFKYKWHEELWKDDDHLLDEMRWGLEYLLKQQDESGGIYYGQIPGKLTKEERKKLKFDWYVQSYFTDNKPGTEDDKIWNTKIFTAGGVVHYLHASVMANAYRIFKDKDPEFAKKCLNSAEKAWSYIAKTRMSEDRTLPRNGIVATGFKTIAGSSLFKATGKTEYRKAALEAANELVDMMEFSFSYIPEEKITGFFWNSSAKKNPFINMQYFSTPYIALGYICKSFPDDKEWIKCYAALKTAERFYFEKLCKFNTPYNISCAGFFTEAEVKKELPDNHIGRMLKRHPREKFEPMGKLYLRHFSSCRGMGTTNIPRASNNMVFNTAAALTALALVTNSCKAEELAKDHINWMLGGNPFAVCTLTGVGKDPILGTSGDSFIPGKVVTGAIGWDYNTSSPCHFRNARAYCATQWKESGVRSSGPFIFAAGVLSAPAMISGTLCKNGKALSGQEISIERKGKIHKLKSGSDGKFGPVEVNAGGVWTIRTGSIEIPVQTISGKKYDIPLDTASEISIKLIMPEEISSSGKHMVKAEVKSMGKEKSKHKLELRLFKLKTDNPVKEIEIGPGEKSEINWNVQAENPNCAYTAVLVPDGQLVKRSEKTGIIK